MMTKYKVISRVYNLDIKQFDKDLLIIILFYLLYDVFFNYYLDN